MPAPTQQLPVPTRHPALEQRLPTEKQAAEDWYIGESEVQGQGVFAGRDFEAGESIGLAMTPGDTDEYGSKIWNLATLARYCNHQENNNVIVDKNGDSFDLVASRPISQDDELDSNYKQVSQAIGPRSRMMWEGKDVPAASYDDYIEKESDDNGTKDP